MFISLAGCGKKRPAGAQRHDASSCLPVRPACLRADTHRQASLLRTIIYASFLRFRHAEGGVACISSFCTSLPAIGFI